MIVVLVLLALSLVLNFILLSRRTSKRMLYFDSLPLEYDGEKLWLVD